MTLVELKKFIINKAVPSEFMIFITKENHFLANQYISAIKEIAGNTINKIESIYEPSHSSLTLLTNPEAINILTVETFEERAENYNQFENVIVVCEQVDKSILKDVEDYVVRFPKLEEWQIFDYAKIMCPGLEDSDLTWLIQATGNNIERVAADLEKVAMFPKEQQPAIFAAIRFEIQSELFTADFLATTNALVDGDLAYLFSLIKQNNFDELEPVALANRTLTVLKNILITTQSFAITADDLGISQKQFNFIRNKYRSLNAQAVQNKIKFLANFDLDLKTSKLDLNKRDMLSYLIANLGYKITL